MAKCQSAGPSFCATPDRCQSPGSGFTLQPTSDRIMAKRPMSILRVSIVAGMVGLLEPTNPAVLPALMPQQLAVGGGGVAGGGG